MDKKQLTKEQWAAIERKLTSVFGSVELLIDGYKISLQIHQHRMRLSIAVYINGMMNFDKMSEGTEEQRRFLCPRKKYVYSAKYRKSVKRMRKSLRETMGYDANRVWIHYWPWWTSFCLLKAHLIKNNESIELIQEPQS